MKTLLNLTVAAVIAVSANAAFAEHNHKHHAKHKRQPVAERHYNDRGYERTGHDRNWFDRNTAARNTYFGYKVQQTGNPGEHMQARRVVKQH